MPKTTRHLFITLSAILILTASLAIALDQPQHHQEARQEKKQQFSRQTLEKYALISGELGKIQREAAQELAAIQDQEKAKEEQQKAILKTISLIEEQGLDVPTYNQITLQMAADQNLRKKVEQLSRTRD